MATTGAMAESFAAALRRASPNDAGAPKLQVDSEPESSLQSMFPMTLAPVEEKRQR